MIRSASCRAVFWSKKYKGFSKFIKGKKSNPLFKFNISKQFLSPNRISGGEYWGPYVSLDTKIGQIDVCHILMSYASFVIIWQFMSYDAYDIEMWHLSIWLILVSKEASEPQHSHPLIRFEQKNCFKMFYLKSGSDFFSFISFENPLNSSLKNTALQEALPILSQRWALCFWNL